MKIIISGIGDVGFHLAKLMSAENHDIVVIDLDKERIQYAEDHLDIISFRGSSTSFKLLEDAEVSESDLFLAVTDSDEVNLTSCMIAKNMGSKHCIARISNPEFTTANQKQFFNNMGVDGMIFPEEIAAKEIQRLVTKAEFSEYFDFFEKKLAIAGIEISPDAELANQTLEESKYLNANDDFFPVAILRNGETIIPRRNTVIMVGDQVFFVHEPHVGNKLLQISGNPKINISKIMIVGGGKIGEAAAKFLENDYQVKLIEKNKDRAFELAERLSNTLVIHGDGRDVELLEEEDLENMDAFIALEDNSETNIISSMVAKNHDVRKTITLVDNIDYINISKNIGVDALINKKLIAADNIFRYVRKGDISDLISIPGLDIEVLEFIVRNTCKINNKQIKNLGFPKNAIISGVIRNNRGYITMGDFVIQENDRVIVVSKPEAIKKVEAFFSQN